MRNLSAKANLSAVTAALVVVGIAATALAVAGPASSGHTSRTAGEPLAAASSPPAESAPSASPAPTDSTPPHDTWSPTAQQIADVATVAASIAASNGDAQAVTGTWVASTRNSYLSTLGEGIANDGSGNDAEIVVVLEGKFVVTTAHVPVGAATPHGNAIDFAWDPATGRVTDWGVDASAPSLAALGQTHTLSLAAHSAPASSASRGR